jgi:DNA end-binding protein Ku
MAARSFWKGFLRISLVSVPVRGYSATSASASIQLNQLHAECHNRIKYQKTCAIHGEVSKEEIVSGYEYAKGQYVVIEPEEIKKLRADSDQVISVDAIVGPDVISPLYYTDKTYYLLPEGDVAERPYALLHQCLGEDQLQAVARVVLYGRDELVVVRPVERLLAMTALKYEAEVRRPEGFGDELGDPGKLDAEEISLTKTLLKSFAKRKFSLASYKDEYVERLRQLIEAKVEGKELVTPPAAKEPQVINLMDALKRSLAQAGAGEGEGKPARKMAPSARRAKPAAKQRRKSG